MRKLAFSLSALFIIAAVFINCSKEIERTPTCFDGIQNQDETGIDCGGHCKLCNQAPVNVVPPCNPANNTIRFGSPTYSMFVYDQTSSVYTITGNSSGGDLEITMPSRPTADGFYIIDSNCPTSFLSGNHACMVFTAFNNYYANPGDTLYVNMVSGTPVITWCNLTLTGPASVNSSGKVTCP